MSADLQDCGASHEPMIDQLPDTRLDVFVALDGASISLVRLAETTAITRRQLG